MGVLFTVIKIIPLWGWLLLALLLWVGVTTFRDRTISRQQLFRMPILLLLWVVIMLLMGNGKLSYTAPGALVGWLIGVAIGWILAASRPSIRRHPELAEQVIRPGSYLPFILILIALLVIFVVSVTLSRSPVLINSTSVNLLLGVIIGLLPGLFWGMVFNNLARLRKD